MILLRTAVDNDRTLDKEANRQVRAVYNR